MAKRKPEPSEASSFEQALAELEAIIDAMEHQSLPLEQLVQQYEQGARLLADCERTLKTARQRLETIAVRSNDDATVADSAPVTPPTGTASNDDDLRFF